jgi:hypothetical protein
MTALRVLRMPYVICSQHPRPRALVIVAAMRFAWLVILVGCSGSMTTTVTPDGMDSKSDDGTMTTDDASVGVPTAAELLAKLTACNMIGGNYATDSGGAQTIPVCGLPSAVFWKADLDIDCDGKPSTECNLTTDPAFSDQTAAVDSHGDPLDAAALPYVVVPLPSTRFDYRNHALMLGSVIAVIYQNRVEYGVFGDLGPTSIIGEASYRMADLLGINPDPSTGGVGSGVAYIAFTGSSAVVSVMEDHDEAVQIGIAKARALLAQ